MNWWAVIFGAAIGSPCRFLVDAAVSHRFGRAQPWGTLAVNLSGSAILGVLAGMLASGNLSSAGYALFGIGFCGAFTTFSTFVWECVALVEDRRVRAALWTVALTLVVGIGFAYIGYTLLASMPRHHL